MKRIWVVWGVVGCISAMPAVAIAQTEGNLDEPGSSPTRSRSAAPPQPSSSMHRSPATSTLPPMQTEAERDEHDRERRDEEEDDGDGRQADLIWIEGQFGYSYVNLVQFSDENFLPSAEEVKGHGYTAGLAAGFRILFLQIGARATLASYEGFEVGTLGADIQVRLPVPVVEPYARVGFGYGWVGTADYETPEASTTDVFGLALDAGVGLDLYLSDIVAIGMGMDAAFLNLSRQRIDQSGCSDATCEVGTINFEEDGDAAGLQIRAHLHASLHF